MPRYISKIRLERKVFFFGFLCVYALGFVLLHLIGEKANENPYHVLMFLAPLLIFIGFWGMFCSLTLMPRLSHNSEHEGEKLEK